MKHLLIESCFFEVAFLVIFDSFFFRVFKKNIFLNLFFYKNEKCLMHDWKRFLWKKWFFVRFCSHFWRCLMTFLIHFWKWVLPCKNVQKASILELIQSTFGHDLLEFVTKKYFISKKSFFLIPFDAREEHVALKITEN